MQGINTCQNSKKEHGQKICSRDIKPIKQSNTIIQILETIEETNIFDIESITIELPRPVTKLLQPKNYYSATKQNKNLCRVKSQ